MTFQKETEKVRSPEVIKRQGQGPSCYYEEKPRIVGHRRRTNCEAKDRPDIAEAN